MRTLLYCYEFTLKAFKSKKNQYDNEKQALSGLKDVQGIVRWFADYSQTDDGQISLFNHSILTDVARRD